MKQKIIIEENMEEGKIISEISPIMGDNNNNNNNSLLVTTNKALCFARVGKNLVIFLIFGVAIFMLYYASCNNFGKQILSSFSGYNNHSLSSRNDQLVKDEYNELKKVLEEASTSEKTVILTTLNEAWAEPNSIFDIFLESFRSGNNTAWLLKHLVVIAVDDKAYIQCKKLVSHCYFLKTKQSSKMAHEATFMTPVYLDMMWGRLAFLQTILSLGYNFVFTDTDVMWFRNPFPHFTPNSDFQTSCDHYNGNEFDISNVPNNGFLFVRSNYRTIQFYKFWVASRHTYPHLHEQDVFNKIKNGTFIRQLGMKLRFLDTIYFGGFCEPSKDFNKVCTMHANCCIGLGNKINDLHSITKAWKNYLSSNHYSTLSPYSNWGAPHKCRL